MVPQSIEKTVFVLGQVMNSGIPYGFTGATQICQRDLDNCLKNCKDCVNNYVDDCIIFFDNMATHIQDLTKVLS